jgi:hypothetical protein
MLQCRLELAVKSAITIGLLYDPAVEIATVPTAASSAEPAVITSFNAGLFVL